ncbi:MAG: hypothetical protein WAO10_01590 [Candidatus Sulfotelmatobacter sp.]
MERHERGRILGASMFWFGRILDMNRFSNARAVTMVAVLCIGLSGPSAVAGPAESVAADSALDHGYSDLYNLDFTGAQANFAAWEAAHPDDPMGPVSEAAGLLFSEFNRLGILESQFYSTDETFLARPKIAADPVVRVHFQVAITRAETLAQSRFSKDPKDRDGLFAMTMCSGLQADYAALIDHRTLDSLHYTKESSTWAAQLLEVCPNCYDVFLATGFSKYIVGSLYAPFRWLLRLGGLPGDRQGGIADLQLTAEHGRYLAPFARILLAIAYVRDHDKPQAIQLLIGLRAQFPANPLFGRELARLQPGP